MKTPAKKISIIFGTRPEAIKLAPIILALRSCNDILCRVCVTAQHRQMLDQVLQVFDIQADYDMNLMRHDQSLGSFTALALSALDKYLKIDKPDIILVQGDTTTVFCAALAAFYNNIKVGHIEAGLRSWDINAPWPEEANRVMTTKLATIHFAPTALNRNNLLKEGVQKQRIHVTGNTVIDALFLALQKTKKNPPVITDLPDSLQPRYSRGQPSFIVEPRMVLITCHRRENFGNGFDQICQAIKQLAKIFPDVHFVYPVHLNPNILRYVAKQLSMLPNIYLIKPLPYLSFVGLMSRCSLILTDSGGIQEEAPSLGKPVVVMRSTTERPEAVNAGTVRLVGTSSKNIIKTVTDLLTKPNVYKSMVCAHNPYGDGKAAERVLNILKGLS